MRRALPTQYPSQNRDYTVIAHPMRRLGVSSRPGDDTPVVSLSIALLAMSAIVLLVACLNLANMLLARAASRRREVAIRLSIGAGRLHVVRQLLTEALLLSLAGGMGGLLLAWWATRLLVRSEVPLMPMPVSLDVAPDWRVLVFTLVLSMLATAAFALGPALRASRAGVLAGLKEHAGEDLQRNGGALRARNLLLGSQMALSLALLVAGALFVKGAVNASRATPGFPLERGLIVEVDPSLSALTSEQSATAHRRLIAHLRTLPGVEAVSMASIVPFGSVSESERVERLSAGQTAASGQATAGMLTSEATFAVISADYFRLLGLQLVGGREFTVEEAEGGIGQRVAIIDEPLARRLFPAPGDNPVGQSIQIRTREPGRQPEALLVVGLVPGLRDELFDRAPRAHVYVPFSIKPRTWMNYHVRLAAGGPAEAAMLRTISREIRAYDERLPVLMAKARRAFVAESVFLWVLRSGARIFTTFGLAALLLAAVGIYGVNAYVVARRTREIGIRVALGATHADITRLIMREAGAVTMAGVAVGLLLAIATGLGLSSMLYEVSAFDPVALAGASLLLAGSALAASYLPARRAARITPVVALRYE